MSGTAAQWAVVRNGVSQVTITAPDGLVLGNGDITVIDGNHYVVRGESLITVGQPESPAPKHTCQYCRNEFRADKRGGCSACGAPQG